MSTARRAIFRAVRSFRSASVLPIININHTSFHTAYSTKRSFHSAIPCCEQTPNTNKSETISVPEWFKELRDDPDVRKRLYNYDVDFLDPSEYKLKIFDWEHHKYKHPTSNASTTPELHEEVHETPLYHIQRLIPRTDLIKLCGGKGKKYLLVGESYGFADSRDFPTKYSASNPSYLWLDLESDQPKILVQLGLAFPPLLWIPLRATVDALVRFFKELIEIEATSVGRHVQEFDRILQEIDFGPEMYEKDPEKLRDRLFKFLNDKVDPNQPAFRQAHFDEYPNHSHFFIGNVSSPQDIEHHMMNNPFVFNTPILLGSTNRFVSNNSVIVSIFRTVYSRSVIVTECRLDLNMELGDGGHTESDRMIPVFVHVLYPDNQRMSRPGPDRMNQIFKTNFPSNMPVDVIGALFGNSIKDAHGIYKEFYEMVESNDEEDNAPPALAIAHLGVLRYDRFEQDIFNLYHNHPDHYVRLACVKGATEMGLKHRIEEMRKAEKNGEVRDVIEKVLKGWDNDVVNGVKFPVPKAK
jgi:hypothetical protein